MSGVLMCMGAQGVLLGHAAYLLPALLAPHSSIPVDIGMATWLATVPGAVIVFGMAVASFFMDRIGRRASNVISLLPGIVGWTMIYFAESYIVLLIGRILISLAGSGITVVGVVMIGECASPQNRGMFLNLKSACVSLGSGIAHFLCSFVHWRTIAIVGLVPHVVALAITLTWPESPSWLASKKQYNKCKKAFFWLRGVSEESIREVTELIEAQKEMFTKPKNVTTIVKIKDFFNKFTKKDFLKPLLINIVAILVMETSGRHYFPSYALQIMNDVIPSKSSKSSTHYYTLCIDIIVTVSTMVSSILIRKLKVRPLLFTSGIGALVVLVFLCTCLFLTSSGVISTYPWLITCLFIIHFAFENLGCGPIPLSLQGELFPLAHKAIGMSVIGLIYSIILMGTLYSTPYLLLSLNVYGTLAVFGVVMAVSLLILYYTLPETKDKTLQEIENFFKYGKYRLENEPDEVYLEMLKTMK